MPISVGDAIPAVKVMQATAEGPKEVDTGEFFKGRTVGVGVSERLPGAHPPVPEVDPRADFSQPRHVRSAAACR